MGLFKGNATITRYRVSGELEPDFADFADERIKLFSFRSIEETTDELSVGWTSVNDYFDTAFAYTGYMLDPYIALGIRIDRRRVPGGLLKKYHRLEMSKAKRMRDGARLSRDEKEEMKEKARLSLLTRIPPASQLIDMYWDTSSGSLFLGSATGSVRELFEDLFFNTFNLRPEFVIPWQMAVDMTKGGEARDILDQARPINLYQGEA